MVYEIDGSILEGGGQILRISVALSVLRGLPIRVSKIRANRKSGGLAAQHLRGIELARDVCLAKLTGNALKSSEIVFEPGRIQFGCYSADTGTAGSIALLLQVALPCLLFARAESELTLKGGTNAEMAPQIDYTVNVFRPVLTKFGGDFDCFVKRRGFFPAGQGIINVKVHPVDYLQPVTLTDFGQVTSVYGEAFVAGVLSFKMAEEMATSARQVFHNVANIKIDIKALKYSSEQAFGNGSGINLVATTSSGCYLGSSGLGRRGVDSRAVGSNAAVELLDQLQRKLCVDKHMQDQIIILMALAKGRSQVRAGAVTLHTRTAIHLSEQLTGARFSIEETSGADSVIITCDGVGHNSQL